MRCLKCGHAMLKLPEPPPGSLWRKLYTTTHHCLACGANYPKEPTMAPLKPKPWWLRLVTPRDVWVTLEPNIYHPLSVQPLESYFDQLDMVRKHEAVLAHEEAHIEQQKRYGLLRYIALYFLSRRFRYESELEAAIKELRVIRHRHGFHAYTERAHTIALQLDSVRYGWAAPSYDDAFNRMVQGVLR